MPEYPLAKEKINELETLCKNAPPEMVERDWQWNGEDSVEVLVTDLQATAFYQAVREMVPYLIEEVRRCRKGLK